MKVTIEGWADGQPIPPKFAFGKIPTDGHFEFGGNLNPSISWEEAPAATQSFVLLCCDPDVPSRPDDVNQEGKTVSADLPRIDFFHWVLVDIPPSLTSIAEGAASNGITARGKSTGEKPYGTAGKNDYTLWFEGDADMAGIYGDYDGPCPPWNDEIIHHYHFTVYALDVATLNLQGDFSGSQVLAAIKGHVLDQASYVGTYTMNRNI